MFPPLLTATVTPVHGPVQFVTIVVTAFPIRFILTGVCPGHCSVSNVVCEALLYAFRLTSVRGVIKVNTPLVRLAPFNDTLLVVNNFRGADKYQLLSVPQLITPLGYGPVNTLFSPNASSNLTVICAPGVTVRVDVDVGV